MLKKCLSGLILMGIVLLVTASVIGSDKEKSQPKYIGAKKCKMCHVSKKKGNQFGHWQASEHAKAFETLGTEQAKELAKKQDIKEPQKSEKCLKCHVTAFGTDEELLTKSFKQENGVQCEACHGPGSEYKSTTVMKDHQKSLDNGLIIPNGESCRTCHNQESPSYKHFCFKTYFNAVAHPDPRQGHKPPECDCERDDEGKLKCDCPKDEKGECQQGD